jgi:hypothetical protein
MSKNGIYVTDGYTLRYVGEKIKKYFEDINKDYMHISCAQNFQENKEYRVCVPYGPDQTENNYVLCYNYEYDFWSVFDNINSTGFVKLIDDSFFSTRSGLVFMNRNYNDDSDYRDDFDVITSTIRTKWYNLGLSSSRKMLSKLIVHTYQEESVCRISVNYAYDFGESFNELSPVNPSSSRWGEFQWGADSWGNIISEPVSISIDPQKHLYSRFEFTNLDKDVALEILGWTLEAKLLSSKAIKQADEQ